MTQTAHVAARKPPSCILLEADHPDGKAPHRPASPWPCAPRRAARRPVPATVYRAAHFIACLLTLYDFLRCSAHRALKNFAGVCCAGMPASHRNGLSEAAFAGHMSHRFGHMSHRFGHMSHHFPGSRARDRARWGVRMCADVRGLGRGPTDLICQCGIRPGAAREEARSHGRGLVVSVYLSRAIARCGVRCVRIRSVHARFQLGSTVNPDGSKTVRIQGARRKVTHPAATRCPTPCRTSAGPPEHRRAPEYHRATGFRRARAPAHREAGCAARRARGRIA